MKFNNDHLEKERQSCLLACREAIMFIVCRWTLKEQAGETAQNKMVEKKPEWYFSRSVHTRDIQ